MCSSDKILLVSVIKSCKIRQAVRRQQCEGEGQFSQASHEWLMACGSLAVFIGRLVSGLWLASYKNLALQGQRGKKIT